MAHIFEILLIEDNPGDVELTREVFEESGRECHISVAQDGEEALSFLLRQGIYAHAPRPDLILLDLNLPRRDGKEVLRHIKADEELRHIPVVVMTSSQAERDITMCYELHANCYVIKPTDLQNFMGAVSAIERFWLGQVTLLRRDAL